MPLTESLGWSNPSGAIMRRMADVKVKLKKENQGYRR